MNNKASLEYLENKTKHFARLSPFTTYVFLFLLIIASIRGIFILYFSIPSEIVYFVTSSSLIIFSLCGLVISFNKNSIIPTKLSKLMHLNLFLGIVFVLLSYFFRILFLMSIDLKISIIYIFIAPFSVFLFTKLSKRNLIFAVAIIATLIAYSVISDFNLLSLGKAGFEKALEYQKMLRPAATSLDRIGKYIQPHGYTGDKHDSANILGMVFIFFFTYSLIKENYLYISVSLISFLALHLTGSATNILIAYITALFAVIFISFKKRNFNFLVYLLSTIFLFVIIFNLFGGNYLGIFLDKIKPNSFNKGMLNGLDFETVFSALPFLISGHAIDFRNSISSLTEVSQLKIIFEFGLVPAILIFSVLLYPVVLWRKKNYLLKAFPAIAAILFGFFSLIHYGSLFRITSIFLFFSIYSLSLKELREYKYKNSFQGLKEIKVNIKLNNHVKYIFKRA